MSTEYVSKAIAAERLGLSVRRVLELSAAGLLTRYTVRDLVTKRRQTVFRTEEVNRVVAEGNRRLVAHRGGAVEIPPAAHKQAALGAHNSFMTTKALVRDRLEGFALRQRARDERRRRQFSALRRGSAVAEQQTWNGQTSHDG